MEFKDKLVAENDKAKFYSNSLTEDFNSTEKYKKLGLTVLLVKLKGIPETVFLLCQKGEPVMEHTNIEEICSRADIMVVAASYE